MRRNFNYTNRKRILATAVGFELKRDEEGRRSFDGDLDLSGLELPGSAKVYVEAFYGRSLARFDFGTVAELTKPANRSLDEVDFTDRLTFRVKVVDESGLNGRILALADAVDLKLAVNESTGRRPLLPVSYSDRMGEEVWRVRFTATGPVLEVNATIPGVAAVVESDRAFGALVRPAALRTVLLQLLVVESMALEDSGYFTWQGRWLLFAKQFLPLPLPAMAELEDKTAWIDECVREFSARTAAKSSFSQALSRED